MTCRLWKVPKPNSKSDVAEWESLTTLRGHSGGLRAIAWSPDGSQLSTASVDATAQIWQACDSSLSEWDVEGTLVGHTDAVRSISWSPDGSKILTGSEDKNARIWQLIGGQVGEQADEPAADMANLVEVHESDVLRCTL